MAQKYHRLSRPLFITIYVVLLVGVIVFLQSCGAAPVPRPDGFFRIEPYPASYHRDTVGRMSLLINDSARCDVLRAGNPGEYAWCNVVYPRYNATVYLSFIDAPARSGLAELLAESRDLVYRQSVGAARVEAVEYVDADKPLYAILYHLSAASATPLQFVATDSLSCLVRGALYYDHSPLRPDSVAPTIEYLADEMAVMIESLLPVAPLK